MKVPIVLLFFKWNLWNDIQICFWWQLNLTFCCCLLYCCIIVGVTAPPGGWSKIAENVVLFSAADVPWMSPESVSKPRHLWGSRRRICLHLCSRIHRFGMFCSHNSQVTLENQLLSSVGFWKTSLSTFIVALCIVF